MACRCGCGKPPGRRSAYGYATRHCYHRDPARAGERQRLALRAGRANGRAAQRRLAQQTPAERRAYQRGYVAAYRAWKWRHDALRVEVLALRRQLARAA